MNKPNFIGIGGERCGSTWLWKHLKSHPDVYLPAVKEIQFFSRRLWRRTPLPDLEELLGIREEPISQADEASLARLLEASIIQLRAHFGSVPDYQAIFSHCPQDSICGDISPQYSCLEEEQIRLMAEVNPEMKILFCIRHPIERMLSSALLKCHEAGNELSSDFIERMALWPAQRRQSAYSETYSLYREVFKKDNILILPFEMISHEPVKFLRQVCKFLGVEFAASDFPDLKKVVNSPADKKELANIDFTHLSLPDYSTEYEFADRVLPGLGNEWRRLTKKNFS